MTALSVATSRHRCLADLERREPDSVAYIHPQRAFADIVVSFGPIEERHEATDDPLSATVLLRPTIPHPDLVLGAHR